VTENLIINTFLIIQGLIISLTDWLIHDTLLISELNEMNLKIVLRSPTLGCLSYRCLRISTLIYG